jgi:hypothetical protein
MTKAIRQKRERTTRHRSRSSCSCCAKAREGNARIRLSCGHSFHTECIERTGVARCPICSSKISAKQCLEIFDGTLLHIIVEDVFALPSFQRDLAIESYELINSASMTSHGALLINNMLKMCRAITEHSQQQWVYGISHEGFLMSQASYLFLNM